jgi:hypothetical protein
MDVKGFSLKKLLSKESFLPPKAAYKEANVLLFATWLLFTFTVFNGVARKWVTGPGAISNGIFFIQLLLPFIFYYLVQRSKVPSRFQSPTLYILFVFYLIMAALNPKNHTLYHGIFGLLLHLAFWAGVIVYYKKRRFFELEKLTGLFIVILVAEIGLASVQYSLPGSDFLNRYASGDENSATVGNAFRVSGSFSFLGGFQAMISFYAFFVWFLVVRRYPPYIVMIVFALGAFGGLVSGSRTTMAMFLLISGFSFVHSGFVVKKVFNIIITALVLGLAVFYFGGSLMKRFEEAYDNFQARIEWGNKSGEFQGRVNWTYEEIVEFKGKYPVLGIGLGSTYQGANSLFGESSYAKEYGYYESETGRIILEGGYILLVLRIILFFVMMRFSYVPWLGKLVLFFFFFNNMIIFNTYQSTFFLLGLILVDRAYYINRFERRLG